MFYINLEIQDIKISSIEKEDLEKVYQWLSCEDSFIEYRQFYERFLEYYLSECEFFLKINKNSNLIGIIKGKVEFKNPNEVWLSYFILESRMRNQGIGSEILNGIINYFFKDCGIVKFYVKVKENNFKSLVFLRKNNFSPIKLSQGIGDKNVILISSINRI
ncbi:GNAT family N-acetyltransferase [Clostridium bovifaecis]|uniref:GNAT family N-acetyltransferase n=1 Tax=Clostridium bovifaecis TaxID=2184719 RepID=A0A6I6F0V5_9CLOT|nr:GNAT family N-acetyltransferase [Clostridium bovifaecis]